MEPLIPATPGGGRPRLATVWLGGCAGCHMSLLDLDEALLDVLARAELVYGPLVDAKTFPEGVDVTLVEGAVANEEHLALLRTARARTRVLVALGDCAGTGNVTALRNALGGAGPILDRAYRELADPGGAPPEAPGILPRLLDRVLPVHHVVRVDAFLPGCPPEPGEILRVIEDAWRGVASAGGATPLSPALSPRFAGGEGDGSCGLPGSTSSSPGFAGGEGDGSCGLPRSTSSSPRFAGGEGDGSCGLPGSTSSSPRFAGGEGEKGP